jgi:hypothetical protein
MDLDLLYTLIVEAVLEQGLKFQPWEAEEIAERVVTEVQARAETEPTA